MHVCACHVPDTWYSNTYDSTSVESEYVGLTENQVRESKTIYNNYAKYTFYTKNYICVWIWLKTGIFLDSKISLIRGMSQEPTKESCGSFRLYILYIKEIQFVKICCKATLENTPTSSPPADTYPSCSSIMKVSIH